MEMQLRGIPFVRQPQVEVSYKGHDVGYGRPDFLVGGHLIVELKTVTGLLSVHQAQVLSYLKAIKSSLGLLLNFKEKYMRSGIKRIVYSPAQRALHGQQSAGEMQQSQEADGRLLVARSNPSKPLQVVKENFNSKS